MPISKVQTPGGEIVKVEHPDGATQEEIIAFAQQNYQPAPQIKAEAMNLDPTAGMSGWDKFAAGMGKGMTDLAYGAGQMVGLVDQDDVRAKQKIDAPLSGSGWQATAGDITGKIATGIPAMLIPGANTAAGATLTGAAIGAAEPVADGNVASGKLRNAAVGAGGGLAGYGAGKYLMNRVGSYTGNKAGHRASQQAANQVKDETVRNARQLGYKVNPTQANPTIKNQLLEGLSGKIKTQQLAAERNQGVTNAIAKRALGIPDDAPLTPNAIDDVRKSAGKAYEVVKNIDGRIVADDDYIRSLASILDENKALAQDFPELADEGLDKLVNSVAKRDFSPAGAVEAIKRLRSNATTMFKSDDPAKVAAARASKKAADAMEAMVERHLANSGNVSVYDQFKQARELIAKSYSIEDALNEGSGNVVARKLASQLGKKPLSGELRQAAQFAEAFPKATQEITSSMPMISPLDVYAYGATSIASGNPAIMAGIGARPMARSALLSKFYQNRNLAPNYGPKLYESLLGLAGPRMPAAGALLGSRVAIEQ